MNKYNKIISISDQCLSFLQSKETGSPIYRQIDLKGLSESDIIKKLIFLIKEFKIVRNQMVGVVDRHNVLMRFMTLPSRDVIELKKMVALQITNLIPYAVEEVVFDTVVLGNAGGSNFKVMVVIVPKETITRHWKLYTAAGLFPENITVSSFGIWGWYKKRQLDKSGVTLVIDINEYDGEICLCGSEYLYISRALRLSPSVFESGQFKFLFKEIDLTVESYMQENLGPLPSKIVLTGSKAMPASFLVELRKEYEIIVEDLNIAADVKGTMDSAVSHIGLSFAHTAHRVNLVPLDLVNAHYKLQVKHAIHRMGLAFLILILLVAGIFTLHVSRKNVYLSHLNNQWVGVKKQLDDIEKTKKRITVMSDALNNRIVFAEIFKAVTQSAPTGISLFNMNLSGDRVLSMQGVAINQLDINTFQENLISSALFSSVRLDFVNKRATQEAEQSYFKISCQIK